MVDRERRERIETILESTPGIGKGAPAMADDPFWLPDGFVPAHLPGEDAMTRRVIASMLLKWMDGLDDAPAWARDERIERKLAEWSGGASESEPSEPGPSFLRTVATVLPDGETVTFREGIDPAGDVAGARTAKRVDHGAFVPHHEFRRIACSGCGGMHWEPRQKALAFRFCPRCGALFTGFESSPGKTERFGDR